MDWTTETYRLDEVCDKFPLPCAVYVTEGYYSESDAESISSGDIFKIDRRLNLQKVASNFVSDFNVRIAGELPGSDYVDLVNKEILVPLNYKGKLKVIKEELQKFNRVSDLAKEFPRYAKLLECLTVQLENGAKVELTAGTVIELDRILPGDQKKQGDQLVVGFEKNGKHTFVAIALSSSGRFRTEPDPNEYTLKEAIDRYKLPQVVSFIDDDIKRVYTSDLIEGVENMRTITETIRLNRLVCQNVLVGHYKAEGEADTEEGITSRSLVVLPIDNHEICEIEVHVLQGATDEDYEQIFLVRNVSNKDLEVVDGTLYVDFLVDNGPKRVSATKTKQNIGIGKTRAMLPIPSETPSSSADRVPPQRPPKPSAYTRQDSCDTEGYMDMSSNQPLFPPQNSCDTEGYMDMSSNQPLFPLKRPPKRPPKPGRVKHDTNSDEDDGYIIPETPKHVYKTPPAARPLAQPLSPRQPPVNTDVEDDPDYITPDPPSGFDFSLADTDFEKDESELYKNTTKRGIAEKLKSLAPWKKHPEETSNPETKMPTNKPAKKHHKDKLAPPTTATSPTAEIKPLTSNRKPAELPNEPEQQDDDPHEYDQVDEKKMTDWTAHRGKRAGKTATRTNTDSSTRTNTERPIATVSPQNKVSMYETNAKIGKDFYELSCVELEERLKKCGMDSLREVCKDNKLDGAFFKNLSDDDLKLDPFNMNQFHLTKLAMVKNNWIPS